MKNRSEDDHYLWNFSPLLDKMRRTGSSWHNRSLSLKGKVTVYNSLVSSLIQYVNMNTTTPSRVTKETQKIATSFPWDKKKSKVAYHTIIQKIQDGGLGLMDLDSRTKANHIGWIKRILRDPLSSSAEMIRNILNEENISLALAFKTYVPTAVPIRSPFYKAILNTWFASRDFSPSGEHEICGEVLWNNHFVSSPRNFLRHDQWRRWIQAGITQVKHICHGTEGRILGQEEINEKFHVKCNFLEALRVRKSIPFAWRSQISANFKEDVPLKHLISINGKKFEVLSSTPRQWYYEWVGTVNTPFSRTESWMKELPPPPCRDLT